MTAHTHLGALTGTVELAGRDVLDVGCGAGELVRSLRAIGARPTGAECSDEMRARAIEADPGHTDAYVDAPAEALPFEDASFDVVLFVYSLHHVPAGSIVTALREARRVLRVGGRVCVVEPVGRTPDTYAAFPVVDERAEFALAQASLDGSTGSGLVELSRLEYVTESRFRDFDSWLGQLVGVDPDREASAHEHRQHLRERFERFGRRRDGEIVLENRSLLRVFGPVGDS